MRKTAFTLAEVMITLGIIGIVAALTIPALFTKIQEKVYINRLKDTYAIFSEAYKQATIENDEPCSWDLGGTSSAENANKLFDYLVPHLKIAGICDKNKNKKYCFYDGDYKALFDTKFGEQPKTTSSYSKQGQLFNGVTFAIWTPGSCSCGESGSCGALYVDINGSAPPNKAGVDYFLFSLRGNGRIVLPTPNGKDVWICKYNDTSAYNGTKCTKWVIMKGNMDYLRRDISSELQNL